MEGGVQSLGEMPPFPIPSIVLERPSTASTQSAESPTSQTAHCMTRDRKRKFTTGTNQDVAKRRKLNDSTNNGSASQPLEDRGSGPSLQIGPQHRGGYGVLPPSALLKPSQTNSGMAFQQQQTTLDRNSDTMSHFLSSLLSKSSDSTSGQNACGSTVDFAKLLSSPESASKLSQLIPAVNGRANLSTNANPVAATSNVNVPSTTNQPTVGLPNINNTMITTNRLPIQSVNNIGHSINNFIFGPSPSATTGFTTKNGGDVPKSMTTTTAETVTPSTVVDASSALPTGLQKQLLSAMKGLNGLPSQTNIDEELEREQNKSNVRKMISQQLDNLKKQIERQEEDDNLRLQALQIMKLWQNQMQNKPPPPQNQLPINIQSVSSGIPLTISPANNNNFGTSLTTPLSACNTSAANTFSSGPTTGPPLSAPILPLPKFLPILPAFEAKNILKSSSNQQKPSIKVQQPDPPQLNVGHLVKEQNQHCDPNPNPNGAQINPLQLPQSINRRRSRSTVQPQLVCSSVAPADSQSSVKTLPPMSNSKEWSAVSHSDDFKQSLIGFKEDAVQSSYQGHGRVTIISATGKIQPRKDMDASQCALLCNLMVELCFTEALNNGRTAHHIPNNLQSVRVQNIGGPISSHSNTAINGLPKRLKPEMKPFKIDPEICLRMNLNTGSKLNGFSNMILGSSHQGQSTRGEQRSVINIVPPTFQQTSSPIQSVNIAPPPIPSISSFSMNGVVSMPGLENDAIVSSSSDTANDGNFDEQNHGKSAETELGFEGSVSDKEEC